MASLTFEQARRSVLEQVGRSAETSGVETVDILSAAGRVLAEPLLADRDQPPINRAMRDGFAVRAEDVPGNLRIIGEVRAGEIFAASVAPGEAVEIMTGAPVPAGANAVLMIEHAERSGGEVSTNRHLELYENINRQGTEARCGETILTSGTRIRYPAVAALAAVGKASVSVFRKPRVAILPTGDELISINQQPLPFQVRNSNAHSLAAQVARAGGEPSLLPAARDEWEATRTAIAQGLEADLLLLSGGVSAGKYDIVEKVLASLGAEFFFDRVLIQPGKPLVFGRAKGKFFFGLPGNPVSTMVTFELFARAALELLGGQAEPSLPLLWTHLDGELRHSPGFTRFLPGRLSPDGSRITPIAWHGSGDVTTLARANAFLVADPAREHWAAGDSIQVLPQ